MESQRHRNTNAARADSYRQTRRDRPSTSGYMVAAAATAAALFFVLWWMLQDEENPWVPAGLANGRPNNSDVVMPRFRHSSTSLVRCCFSTPRFSRDSLAITHVTQSGTGSITTSSMGPLPNQYTVNVTGVTTATTFTATLVNALDAEHGSDRSL